MSRETLGFSRQTRGFFTNDYCPISINSAAPVTRDTPAEILVSADARNGRDIIFFPAGWAG
jgi:hypothetical protein